MKTFYEVLGIREDATIEEIEYAYEVQTKKLSKFLDDPEKGEKAKKRMKNVDVAHKILINISSRKAYDNDLKNMRANELMNSLQQNTNKYNQEKQKELEIEEQRKQEELKRKKQEEFEAQKRALELRRDEQTKKIQEEIDKQVVEQQRAAEEKQKQQEQQKKEQQELLKRQEKIEKEKIKVVKKYMKDNGLIKMSLGERIFRAIITIIIVICILFIFFQLPFVKAIFINNENMNFFLNLFEK